ncbi:hypothetical protein [Horticoccus sp. 23ND18S-11]|uniref:hypothetical protein n=1 Tax=Horticoccus sp. 23ND18S-11 TaxID=3391832 RepID=UPI0039C99EA5
MTLASSELRQFSLITLGAVAVFAIFRLLPTGTNLSHMDFRVDPRATNAIEFCDPLNPQFIPVVASRSPVTLTVATTEPAVAGREVRAVFTLKTGSGKAVAPEDLLVTHTRQLHLLVIDPSLTDYQHVHPTPGSTTGNWHVTFTPRTAGTYRIFADFTPVATGRGLYASVDLVVSAGAAPGPGTMDAKPLRGSVEREGVTFTLETTPAAARAGQPIDLRFALQRRDGAPVPLEPVMGAFAHLVAFDQTRSGFAHLHPAEADLLKRPDAVKPVLNFKLTIPRAGRYVIWAQVNLGGSERFVPFEIEVGG